MTFVALPFLGVLSLPTGKISGLLASQSMKKRNEMEGSAVSFQEYGLEVAQIIIDLWFKLGDKTIPNYKGG